ncbi:MAG: fibronectin type III domain-containing protein, partial [Thermoplasmata archaeon]
CGVANITLDDGNSHENFTHVRVLNVTIDFIQIRDAPGGGGNNLCDSSNYSSYPVGQTTVYYCAAYNSTSGYISDIPVSWSSGDNTIVWVTTPGSSTSVVCSSANSGSATITVDDGYGNTNTTSVTVIPPSVDYILIRSAPAGAGLNLCDPEDYRSYGLGETYAFCGAEYNFTAGYLGGTPASSTWTSTDRNVVAVTSPGASTIITCSITNHGTVTITLNDGLDHIGSTQVTVLEPNVDYIQIRDSPGGHGNVTTAAQFTLGEVTTGTYYCAAYNHTAGYIGDKPGQWTVHGGIGSVSIDTGQSTDFTATDEGTGILTVSYAGSTNSTEITVDPSEETGPPATPANVRAEPLDSEEIIIRWSRNTEPDIEGYILERSRSPEGPWLTLATIDWAQTFYIDEGLEPDTTYHYRLSAVGHDANVSDPSPVVSATTEEPEAFPWFLILLFIVIAIVALLLIIFFIMPKRRERVPPPAIRWAGPYSPPDIPREEVYPMPDDDFFIPDEKLPPFPEDEELPPQKDWEEFFTN